MSDFAATDLCLISRVVQDIHDFLDLLLCRCGIVQLELVSGHIEPVIDLLLKAVAIVLDLVQHGHSLHEIVTYIIDQADDLAAEISFLILEELFAWGELLDRGFADIFDLLILESIEPLFGNLAEQHLCVLDRSLLIGAHIQQGNAICHRSISHAVSHGSSLARGRSSCHASHFRFYHYPRYICCF